MYTAVAVENTAALPPSSILESLLGSRLRARLLGWLFSHPGERYFVRQLAVLLGEDSTNLSRELARLADLGIVTSSREGQLKYFQVNTEAPVFPELRGLVLKTSGLGDLIRESLRPLFDRIHLAFVFGSFAAGRANAASDVDLLVVGDVSLRELVELLSPIQNRLGREVNPVVYPVPEFREKLGQGHRFLTSVLEGPKLFLIGSLHELERLAELRMAD
jgi:predicted nucleotidyltransferase/predicted transcriptional regulator with HTH domain